MFDFCTFEQAIADLPDHHDNPKLNGGIVRLWWHLLQSYSLSFGVVDQYIKSLKASEVCLFNRLPVLQQYNSFTEQAGTWLLDCTYCDKTDDREMLKLACISAAKKWKQTVNVTALIGSSGFLTAHVCDTEKDYPSKKRNEQKQALAAHTNHSLVIVPLIPEDYVMGVLDYWLANNSPITATLSAYLWTVAASTYDKAKLFRFSSDLGDAYLGIAQAGDSYTFNSFWQSPTVRPARIGTAGLSMVRDWLIGNSKITKFYLTTPVFGEDTAYEVYKKHLSTGTEEVGSEYIIYPENPKLPSGPKFIKHTNGSGSWVS